GDTSNWYVHQANGAVAPFPKAGGSYPWVAASLTMASLQPILTFKPYQGQISYVFTPVDNDAVYRLSEILDRNGYATTLAYTSTTGLLRSVTDAAGRALSFSYT